MYLFCVRKKIPVKRCIMKQLFYMNSYRITLFSNKEKIVIMTSNALYIPHLVVNYKNSTRYVQQYLVLYEVNL